MCPLLQASHPVAFTNQLQVLSSVLLLTVARVTHSSLLPVPVYTRCVCDCKHNSQFVCLMMVVIRKWLLLLGFSSFVNVVGKFAA
jgi:hypothetical protein